MSNTTNLSLFKHDNPSTNTNAFDIERALNENWDKVDTYAGNTNTTLSNKVDKVTGKGLSTNDYTNAEKQQVATNKTDISNIKTEQTTQNNRLSSLETDNTTNKANIQTNTNNITALTGRVSTNETNIATLQTNAGNKIELVLNNTTYVLTATLKNKAGTVLSTSNVDFPVEELIVNMTYDSATKELVITLKNGQTRRISIEDVIDGLVNETDFNALEDRVETNETDIETLQAKNEALEQENEALRNDLNNSTLTISGTGENVTLENTAEARFKKLEVQGNSKQETREGYNLLNVFSEQQPNTSTTINGVTFKINKDGSVIANGTATANTSLNLMRNFELDDGEEYSIYAVGNGSSTTYGLLINQYYDSASHVVGSYTYPQTFTYNEASKNTNSIYIFIASGTTVSNVLFKPMLLKGSYTVSTLPEYEQYGATPSPAYPSEVQTITGNANVVVCNKNLCKLYNNGSISTDGLTITIKNNSEITINGTSTIENWIEVGYKFGSGTTVQENKIITLNKEKSYNLSRTILNGSATGSWYVTFQKAKGSNTDNATVSPSRESALINNSDGIYRIYLNYAQGTVFNNYTIALQLEESSTATTYTAHEHQNYILPLGNMELCKIGDYKDYMFKENNKWYKHKAVEKVELSSTNQSWSSTETSVSGKYRYRTSKYLNIIKKPSSAANMGYILSNYYILQVAGMAGSLGANQGISEDAEGTIFINDDRYPNNLNDWKTWLDTVKPTLYFVLNTPTQEEITDTSLISALNQIEKTAHSYSDITHIYSIDELSPIFDVKAVGDLNKLLTRVETLESEV